MSWLRLPEFDAGDPELVYDGPNLKEVTIRCTPNKLSVGVCCLAQKLVRNGTKEVRYRDRKIEPAPTWLVVPRQRFKCKSCNAVLYQDVPHVDDNHRITIRLRDELRLSSIKRTFRDAVSVHAVEETLARRVFRTFADEQLMNYRFDAPRVFGIDENQLMGAQRGVICDVEKGLLLDMYVGCTQSDVRKGLSRMDNWENVEVWCQDMAGHYKGLARDLFPKAAIVVDKFHLLKMANYWWSKVRISETPTLPAEIKKKMPGMVRLFDKHWETMEPRQQDRVAEVLEHSPRMKMAWTIKESFYYFYDAKTREDAEKAYYQWVQFAKADQHAIWLPLMKTMQRWRNEIFNYFDHRYTSGMVERMNRSIADINRAGNGMDFQTLRAKALLRYSHLIPEQEFKMALWPGFPVEDEDPAETVMRGSGFDPSTLADDLKTGLFDAPSTSFAG